MLVSQKFSKVSTREEIYLTPLPPQRPRKNQKEAFPLGGWKLTAMWREVCTLGVVASQPGSYERLYCFISMPAPGGKKKFPSAWDSLMHILGFPVKTTLHPVPLYFQDWKIFPLLDNWSSFFLADSGQQSCTIHC